MESCEGEFLIVTVFEIRKEEVWLFFCLIFEIWMQRYLLLLVERYKVSILLTS